MIDPVQFLQYHIKSVRVDLPSHLSNGVVREFGDVLHRRRRLPVATVLRALAANHPATVIIDAKEVGRLADDLEVVGLDRRRRGAKLREQLGGIFAQVERVEEPAVMEAIGPLHREDGLWPLIARKDGEEVERGANARALRVRADTGNRQPMRQEQVMPDINRALRVSLQSRRVYARKVPQICATP